MFGATDRMILVSEQAERAILISISLMIVTVQTADVNVALGRPAVQSSTWPNPDSGLCVAGRAVDGNFNTTLGAGSCSHTADAAGGANWWRVDLGQPMHIKLVIVTNRGDAACCFHRLDYFIVGVINETTSPNRGCYAVCGQYPWPAVIGAQHYLQCNPSTESGRYVILQQPANGAGQMALCEVEIYAGQVRHTNRWERHENLRLVTNGTTLLKKRSVTDCVRHCKQTVGCDSINYRHLGNMCEMNFLPRGVIQCDLKKATEWSWWSQIYEFI